MKPSNANFNVNGQFMGITRSCRASPFPSEVRAAGRHRRGCIGMMVATLGYLVSSVAFSQTVAVPQVPQVPQIAATQLPTGGKVINGGAVIQQNGSRIDVNQSTTKAIINWDSFSIGAQAHVNYNQPGINAVVLNRVSAGNPSFIMGKLTSNGQVFLINPDGILFGNGASVNVGSLVASSLPISDGSFLSSDPYLFTFQQTSRPVGNQGSLATNHDGGYIVLLAPEVHNNAAIRAMNGGTIALAAGDNITLPINGSALLGVNVSPAAIGTMIENSGSIQVDGQAGTIFLTAKTTAQLTGGAINNGGITQAKSIIIDNGKTTLSGGGGTPPPVSGGDLSRVVVPVSLPGSNVQPAIANIGSPVAPQQPQTMQMPGSIGQPLQQPLFPPNSSPLPQQPMMFGSPLQQQPMPGSNMQTQNQPQPLQGMPNNQIQPQPLDVSGDQNLVMQQPQGIPVGQIQLSQQQPVLGNQQAISPQDVQGGQMQSVQPLVVANNQVLPQGPVVMSNSVQPQGPVAGTNQALPQGQVVVNNSVQPQGQVAGNNPSQPQGQFVVNNQGQPQGQGMVNNQGQPQGQGVANNQGQPQGQVVAKSQQNQQSQGNNKTKSGDSEKPKNQGGGPSHKGDAGGRLAQFAAAEAARHRARAELYKEALSILEQNPNAADVPPCGPGSGDLCVPQGNAVVQDRQGEKLAAGAEVALNMDSFLTLGPLPPVPVQRKVAYLIGNNDYKGAIPLLKTPISDIEAIGQQLNQSLGYEVNLIRNATKADMIRVLKNVAENATQDESVLIMYAGHGYQMDESKQGFWIPVDGLSSDPANWLSNRDITRFMNAIQAKQVILISDSCFSGTLTKEQKIKTNAKSKKENILSRRSVLVLSSGGEEPVSDEGKDGHSIFAYSLIKQIKEVKDFATGSQLFDNIKAEVTSEYPQVPQLGAVTSAGHMMGGNFLFEAKSFGMDLK